MSVDIGNLFAQAAYKWPDAEALREVSSGRTLSFAELDSALLAVGQALQTLQIGPGERVALLADASIDYLLADYGIMASGRVRVPLDGSLSLAELLAQVRDAGAALLLFSAEHQATADALSAQGIHCEPLARIAGYPVTCGRRRVIQAPDELASLSYTGGTTGKPKAVMHSHATLVAVLQNIVMARGALPGDVLVNVRPLWPIAAVAVLGHLLSGGRVLLAGRFEAKHFIAVLQHQQAAFTSLVPTQLLRLLRESGSEPARLPALKCVDVGAAAMSPEVFEGASRLFGERLGVLYGMTEAPWSCYLPPAQLAQARHRGERVEGLVGRPVFSAGMCIHQPDEQGVGEILLAGPQLMRGYWRQAELSASVMHESWLRSGDLGVMLAGGLFRVLGRSKDTIRSGGKSVQPSEVEQCLQAHAQVADVHVFGLPDEEWGERVCAAIVPHGEPTREQLLAHCRAQLSRFKVPKQLFFVAELPRSHYGKVQRKRLLELLD
ncbi:Acyl-CoA synthetase (AMP-forming)/AMP-acid ligase II [Pseudomonas flavescens]|uniref:Acyl-CoA synthetase (AMP-forming)/AMP-acid ligase II n=1 Tax=Phytopseudomonas flavescens TaxID=29435 RepID=A0A1G8AC85_9GAMM|nr:class I adenylate-forming enzyme family protein [Pseudomonas flavescens]SDH18511.1 Acyl-CoA synthetase (AMP-forming)/AMP-acid ligase II [Pseudomonas flavescens]